MPRITVEEVRAFTIEELWDLPAGVTEQTSLAHDFRIAGLDGKQFMEKYATRFDVSLDGFDWTVYFGSESLGLAWPLGMASHLWRRCVKGLPPRDLVGLPELTLGHLAECANHGRWHNPEQRMRAQSPRQNWRPDVP